MVKYAFSFISFMGRRLGKSSETRGEIEEKNISINLVKLKMQPDGKVNESYTGNTKELQRRQHERRWK